MKYFSPLFVILSLALFSCNNNDSPDLEITLPVAETYVPASIEFDVHDIDDEQKRDLIRLANNDHIINDVAELPDDPIGFGEAYHKINFTEYTLLIDYVLHDYTIDTYSTRFFRNTKENSFNWSVNIGTASDMSIETGLMRFTRFAILVRKLPADAQVKFWLGLTQLGWFPETDN